MNTTNAEIARKLREVAAAYTIKKVNFFQIRAYETVAATIEHSTSEVQDLWEEGQLDEIPGLGESLKKHLDELFKTGHVKHWEEVKKGIPEGFFEFLDIPGVGPKTALKLAKWGAKDLEDLRTKLQSGLLIRKGLSGKLAEKVLENLSAVKGEDKRMLLPYAFVQAEKVLEYLRKSPVVNKADVLGSLRRMVATIGDLDFAVASKEPEKVVEYLTKMPGVKEVVDKGETKVTLRLSSGLHLDFLIVGPDTYGALLQHFTGSKSHNIHLRTLAEHKGLSLSEYGIKKVESHPELVSGSNMEMPKRVRHDKQVIPTKTEEEFYSLLDMETPPPEMREDTGEIELAIKHQLPKLLQLEDIKGDLHVHDNFPIEPSRDLGVNSLEEISKKAKGLGYEYTGISDHSPSVGNHTPEQIVNLLKRHKKYIEQNNYSGKSLRVLNLLEVDIQPDGILSVPDEGLKLLDFAIAGVHSVHGLDKEKMTKRLLKALSNPYVKVLAHPTNRLISRRSESDVDWEAIFKLAASKNIALEINAFPDRLDLPDYLVRQAKSFGVKFVIGTDSHEVGSMENMRFGVAVARRGWLTKEDVVNTWDWTRFARWFNIKL